MSCNIVFIRIHTRFHIKDYHRGVQDGHLVYWHFEEAQGDGAEISQPQPLAQLFGHQFHMTFAVPVETSSLQHQLNTTEQNCLRSPKAGNGADL